MTYEYRKWTLPRRRRYQAQNKTVWGKERQRWPKPELAGLDRQTYFKMYMRMWRKD